MDGQWRCSGLRWSARGPELEWDGGRRSPLTWGKRVAFGVGGGLGGGVGGQVGGGRTGRACVGARGNPCPLRAPVPGRSTGARCEECARLDRAHSVAADTLADDPRPYHVYLAWFGPGLTKVGITAVERGPTRLLEQGAVCFSWLGAGPLMSARRAEELLRAALGVPDRIPYADKRAVRSALPVTGAERSAEIAELHGRAVALGGWPEALRRAPLRVVDHTGVFGLAGLPDAFGEVRELVAGGVVGGELVAAAGPDLHLRTGTGTGKGVGAGAGERVVVLDTRLMRGWALTPLPAGIAAAGGDKGEGGDELAVPVREYPREEHQQDGLF
ncbi:DUF2797 domain-containing protein [Streptomyces sp. NPDC048290]|uniref:DUF2797 domain-containing protein n=1 Tax=Streptomyces sp. NPDC048290 TaxID=3155811 RepID=UPI0034125D33